MNASSASAHNPYGQTWPPLPPCEALSEEQLAVLAFARKHPTLRHRELARRMVDEDLAYLSHSTVDRILRQAIPVCPMRRRAKRARPAIEKVSHPDEPGAPT